MLVGKYKASSHSVIRDLFYEACEKTKRFGAENVFDYTLGNPSVPVPAAYDAVLKRLADDPDFTAVHGYSAGAGIESVRAKIAAFLKGRYGLPYAARHIFMASGAASAIAHALRCVVGAGEEVIVFSPFFPEYGPYIDGAGGVMKIVPCDPATLQIDTDAFEKAVTEKTAAVLLNSPCNPTGAVLTPEQMRDIAKIAVMPESTQDVEVLMDATATFTKYASVPAIAMSMGELGLASRTTGERFGSAVTFGTAGKASAPGQLPATELKEILETVHAEG